jgi:Flp pilus assembly protein TadD
MVQKDKLLNDKPVGSMQTMPLSAPEAVKPDEAGSYRRRYAAQMRRAFDGIADGTASELPDPADLPQIAWSIGYGVLQDAAQAADPEPARRLARVLHQHFPARAAAIEVCIKLFAPAGRGDGTASEAAPPIPETAPSAVLLAGLTDDRVVAEPASRLRQLIIQADAELRALAPGRQAPRLGPLALRLAERTELRSDLAAMLPVLLGLDGSVDAAAAGFRSGDRTVELLLHLADLIEQDAPDGSLTEDLVRQLGEAAALELAGSLQSAGLHDGARLAMRALIGTAVMAPADVVRLAQLERGAPAGADPLSVLDVGVLQYPRDSLLRVERGKILSERGARLDAMADARVALADPSASPPVLLGAADLLVAAGEAAEAARILTQKLPLHPASGLLLVRTAQIHSWAGNEAEAIRLARIAVRPGAITEGRDVRLLLARMLGGAGLDAEALAILDPMMARDAAPDLAAAFVEAVLRPIWRSMPDYVDQALAQRLRRAVDQAGPALDLNRLWECVRIFAKLEHAEAARDLCAIALGRQAGSTAAIGSELGILLQDLLSFGLPGEDPGGMGPATLGALLLRQGVALTATGRQLRAQLCFQIAASFAPEDPAIRFNAGFGAIAAGRIRDAYGLFEGMSRLYEEDMARVAWPQVGSLPWPYAPFEHGAAFDVLKPSDQEWPLITVITPSYNQAAYVEETILSVLRQGYPRLQYIIVDGLSTDGSGEIIGRYRNAVDTVIIEKDGGQTEAINKGLRLARGEIVTWLNSDDMFGPGALHAVALNWLRSQADLVFGFCLPHREHGFVLANLPQVRAETFTIQHLGDIFKYWMKGFFFYQPEVFFSRRILEAVGGELREALHYTMDYDFWMRCAKAGATVEPLGWPIALFRQHREQKTANLLDCMLEQAEVRDGFVRPAPPARRRVEVRERLQAALGKARPRIGIVSSRLPKIFSADLASDLAHTLAEMRFELDLAETAAALPRSPDILIRLVHLQNDVEEISALRERGFKGPVVGWFWDNHHHLFTNFDVAEKVDITMPGHHFARQYLRNRDAISGPSLPLCITQWSQREARAFWQENEGLPRSDTLHGGFVRYAFANKRNALIEQLIRSGFDGVYFLEEGYLERYFGLPLRDRFREWASYKASITLPLAGDLSQRLFDALLAGQVPIVPRDVLDLDFVVPPDMQQALPIIRFEKYDMVSVEKAYNEALAAFDRGGAAGARGRHQYALTQHSFTTRAVTLLEQLGDLSQRL